MDTTHKEAPAPKALEVGIVVLGFLALYLSTVSQYYTGDTLYYAHQVDTWLAHRLKIYMFYHFAHVLVIPIAVGFAYLGTTLFGLDSLTSMGLMAGLFGAGTVGLLYGTARRLGLDLFRSLLLSLAFGLSFGLWDYSTVGEDRIQGTFFCAAFLCVFLASWQRSRPIQDLSWARGLLTGLLLGLAVTTHLSNCLLVPFFFLVSLFLYGKAALRSSYLWAGTVSALLLIAAGYLLVAFGNQENPSSFGEFIRLVFSYHSKEQPYFVHRIDLATIASQLLKAGIGTFTAFYYVPEAYIRTTFQLTPTSVRIVLAALFLLASAMAIALLCSSRPDKIDIALGGLVALWGLHQVSFEPISRADWLPILFIAFLLIARAWRRASASPPGRRAARTASLFSVFLPIFVVSLVINNGPHMVQYHKEKNPYVQFIEFCVRNLPQGSLLVEGNGMAITTLDYFHDKYTYPFSVVSFFDVMGLHPAIFCRLKPPPVVVREIDSALSDNRPVFITKRTIDIDPMLREFLEIEYPQEVIDAFLRKYDVVPFRTDSPYSEIYQVFPKKRAVPSSP